MGPFWVFLPRYTPDGSYMGMHARKVAQQLVELSPVFTTYLTKLFENRDTLIAKTSRWFQLTRVESDKCNEYVKRFLRSVCLVPGCIYH